MQQLNFLTNPDTIQLVDPTPLEHAINRTKADAGFCKRFYRAACGRLFVLIPDGLFTCNDDAWREPCSSVKREFFNLHD